MHFNSTSTLLFHFNTFTAAVAEVPQLIVPDYPVTVPRAGKGWSPIRSAGCWEEAQGPGLVCSCMPSLYFTQSKKTHKLRSPQVKIKVIRKDNWEGRSNSPVWVNLGDTWNRKLFYVKFFVTIWFQVRFLGTVDLVFCPVTSIQGVPGLVTLLILVLLGKLLVILDDVGALG